jgi:4-amino-4-deoxy-L-arabinose transferase-like glycosyltransferase
MPLAKLIPFAAGDVHPLLYYLLLHPWVQLVGDASAQLRLFSVLLNIAAMVAMVALAYRILGRTSGSLAAVLFAFSPMLLVYSLEARGYMLLVLLFVCLLHAHWMAVVEGRTSNPLLALYALLAALLFYVHYIAVFLLLGLFVHWLVHTRLVRARVLRLVGTGLLTLALVSPGLRVMLAQHAGKIQMDRETMAGHRDPQSLSFQPAADPPPAKLAQVSGLGKIFGVLAGFYPARGHGAFLLFALPLASVLAAAFYLWLAKGDPVCCLFGTVLLSLLVASFSLHLVATRYMLPLAPPLALAASRVFQSWTASVRWRTLGAGAAACVLAIYLAGFYRQATMPHGHPWQNLVSAVQRNYVPGDEVVFDALYVQVPFDYFAAHSGFHPFETGFPLSSYDWWRRQPFQGWGGPVIYESDLDRFTSSLATPAPHSIWLVLCETNYYDPHNELLARLSRMGNVTEFTLPPDPDVLAGRVEETPRLVRIALPAVSSTPP